MTIISGVLINGFGEPMANTQLKAVALSTGSAVVGAPAYARTGTDGSYSFELELGHYSFSIWFDSLGWQYVGDIQILENTPDSSLDQLLVIPKTSDPVVLTRVLQALIEAEAAAKAASSAATDAATDAAAEVRATLIPLGQQYKDLPTAQAAVTSGAVPAGAYIYIRSSSSSSLADEYQNQSGNLVATGKKMPTSSFVQQVSDAVSRVDGRTDGINKSGKNPFEIVDENGKMALSIDEDAMSHMHGGANISGLKIKKNSQPSEYVIAFTDEYDRVAFGICKDSSVEILGMRIKLTATRSNLIEIIDKQMRVAGGLTRNGVLFSNSSPVSPTSPEYDFLDFAERMHLLIYGQSLSLGAFGTPLLGTAAKDALMYNTGVRSQGTNPTSLVQLSEKINGTYGESIASGMSHDFCDKSGGMMGRKLIVNAAGVGGIQIEGLLKGTTPYTQMMNHFSWCASLMAAAGTQYSVEYMFMMQGEANMAIGSSAADWAAKLKQLRQDIQTDTAQWRDPAKNLVMFTYQTSSHGYYVGSEANPPQVIAQAQLDVALSDPLIDMWGPTYMGLPANRVAGQGNVHHGPHGYRLQGLYASKALRHRMRTRTKDNPDGEKYLPVHATSAYKINNTTYMVDIFTYHPPLVIDSSYVAELADGMHGVEAGDNTGRVPVTSVSIVAGNKIKVVTSATLGEGAYIAFAWTPENRGEIGDAGSGPRYPSWFFGRETGVRTTIHDSDPETTDLLDENGKPYPLFNYLPIQKIMVK